MVFKDVLSDLSISLSGLFDGVINFIPSLLIAIIVFIVGWILGAAVSKAIEHLLNALKINSLFRGIGAEAVLARAGFKLRVGRFVGELVKWFVIIVFLMVALEALNLNQVADFLAQDVLRYIPQVVIAAFIIILATIISDAVGRLIEGSAKAINVRSAKMAGNVAKWAIWVFAIIIALSELGIAPAFMLTLFQGMIAMLAIAGGLAFGLGGKDHASKTLDRVSDALSHK